MELFFTCLINGILVGGVYALVGLGIVLIYKSTAIFNFAAGEMGVIGAFVVWSLMTYLEAPAWISVVVGVGVGWLVGMAVERLALRRMIGQPIISAILATLALAIFLKGLAITIWSANFVVFPTHIFPTATLNLGELKVSAALISAFVVAMLCFAGFVAFFRYSGMGLAMRGVAESHQISQSLGVKVTTVFALIWAIAGAVSAIGAIAVSDRTVLSVNEVPMFALAAFPGVLLGGLESIPGVLVGCLIVGVLENLSNGYLGVAYGGLTPWIVLMVVIIIRPHGLWGLKRIERI